MIFPSNLYVHEVSESLKTSGKCFLSALFLLFLKVLHGIIKSVCFLNSLHTPNEFYQKPLSDSDN